MGMMQRDTQAAIADGVDPDTARQNALLNNMHLLFADNPEEVANIINQKEANSIRDRALLQTKQHQETLATMQALGLKQKKEIADATLAERNRFDTGRLDNEKLRAQPFQASAEDVVNKDTGEATSMVHVSPQRWETTSAKPNPQTAIRDKARTEEQNRRAIMDMEKLLQKDEAYKGLVGDLVQARTDALGGAGEHFWSSTEKNDAAKNAAATKIKMAENAVKDYRNQVAKQFNIDLSPKKGAKASNKSEPQDETLMEPAAPSDKPPIKTSDLKVGVTYRNAKGEPKVFKGLDASGEPIWSE